MSFTAFALVVVGMWLVVGFVMSVWMRRRGHAVFTWSYLGAVLGPLAVPLAIDAVVRERRVRASAPSAGPVGPGVRVLAGIDGSSASLAAAREAADLLGDRLGTMTLAVVVDYETAEAGRTGEQTAHDDLDEAARVLTGVSVERMVVVGAPADALSTAARHGGFDVLVVGPRGRGASRAVLGSVATQLARGAGLPVLIGGTPVGSSTSQVRGAKARAQ